MTPDLSIRKFTDYRAFMAAHVQDLKRKRQDWSYGVWARQLGLKDTSSITKIMNGTREPGTQITESLISYFKFREKEALYFRDLVRLNKIRKDPRLSVLLLEKMSKQHPNSAHRLLDEKTFSVIANWFCLPIREMTRMAGFKDENDWIAKQLKFKVSARDVRQAIDSMIKLGLLKRTEDNRLEVAEGRLATTDDIASEAIKRYHEQMLENAKLAIRENSVHERELQAECLVINSENIEQAKQMIREFREKFSKTFEEEKGDCVYQIQIQLFPLTEKQEKDDVL